jgi:hypothetical protein
MATATQQRAVTRYNDIKVGGMPVAYESESGQVLIMGESLDGHLLIELAARVTRARQREGHAPKSLGFGSSGLNFVALQLDKEGIRREQLEAAWLNLPLYYPETRQDKVRERVKKARALIEK